MGFFSKRSRVPDLRPEQYDAVVKIFQSNLDRHQQEAKITLTLAQERSAETHVDILTVPLGHVRALRIFKSFADFALVTLDDVYVFHSNSHFLSDLAIFTEEIGKIFSSNAVQRDIRLRAEQGSIASVGQQAVWMQPFISQRMYFGQRPNSSIWAMTTTRESREICDYKFLQCLIESWLIARDVVEGQKDVLGLACGWILLQWLEWSEVTPEAFTVISEE